MATVTFEVPDDYPIDQVNLIATDTAAKLAAIRGMNAERVLTPGPLRYRLIERQAPARPAAPKVVSMADRRRTARPSLLPTFTPPSAA